VYLLPDKTKNGKRKTRVKKHTLHPIFDEVLKVGRTSTCYVLCVGGIRRCILMRRIASHSSFNSLKSTLQQTNSEQFAHLDIIIIIIIKLGLNACCSLDAPLIICFYLVPFCA